MSFAHGQCIEHYGTGEAYLPVLAALSQLCRQDEGEQVVRVLRRVAPTWLLQLPALLSEDEYTALQQKLAGATQERMLRELVEALEVLSAERPVVLVLEDVHWSDGSTIDLLNLLARQREVTRVLVLATCRPTELVVTNHPLKQVKHELVTRGLAAEVVLGGLPAEAVQHYVGQRMTVPGEEETVAAFVYQRSEGHPLFMVQMTDYLLQQHGQRAGAATALSVIDQEVPQGLRELIETQIGRLTPDEQQVLEVGSVAGAEFTVASVAAGLQTTGDAIEGICETLARRGQFIVDQGITRWPDGTVSGQYGFRHAMYQEVLYQRLGSGRRSRMHYLIGLCEEARYGEQANEGAAELAMHFERGQDYPRAVAYCCQAAERALHQNAAREGLAHLTNGITLLARMPESQARLRQEVLLHSTLGLPLFRTTGYTAPAVEQAYHRAQALYRQLQETPESFPACLRFWHFTLLRVDLPTAREVAERLVTIAQQAADPDLESLAAYVQGTTAYHRGEWSQVRDSLLRGLETYKIHHDRATILFLSEDRGVASYCHLAIVSWGLGYAAQAQQHIDAALQLAHTLERSLSVVRVWSFAASLAQLRQDWSQLQVIAMTILEMAREHGWLIWRIVGSLGHGRALVGLGRATEGLEEIRQALSTYQTWGAVQMLPHFLSILLEAQLASGQVTDGLATVDEALTVADKTGERWNVAELWRLKGQLTLAQSGVLGPASGVQTQEENEKSKVKSQKSKIPNTQHLTPSTQGVVQEAEEYFLKALAIARQQHAKSLELRAVMSLVRLRQQQALEQGARSKERGVGSKELGVSSEEQGSHARLADAHKLLSDVYGWFTEGFDTKDLQEAKALLGDLEEKAKRGKG